MTRHARLAVPFFVCLLLTAQPRTRNGIVITGPDSPGMGPFDALMTRLMDRYGVQGGALAVGKDGRLVLAHGYGMADAERHEPVKPESLFRLASISKPFTSAAIMKLVEDGKLKLDDRPIDLLSDLKPASGAKVDPRLRQITIRDLLLHAGGWDRDKSFDPMFIPIKAARAVGAPSPASCETVIRYMLGQPLQFDPGSRSNYSNFGYCVLGRVIEHVSGKRYEDYVRDTILAPLGIHRMRSGRSLANKRAPGEVKYYDFPNAPQVASVFGDGEKTPRPYGGFNIEAMDSHGGWIASPIDLVRFMMGMDGSIPPRVLKPASIRQILARPALPEFAKTDNWYGFGWSVRPVGRDANWWHNGSLSGTTTLMVRTSQGMQWAALFNSSPREQDKLFEDLDPGLWDALTSVKNWPTHDLFSQFR
ncbi:MAG: beta-lactamase family protein [Acidobacteriota bacterium]|nr:beta-lactamase family protein [Acidobacteriota bacterium]